MKYPEFQIVTIIKYIYSNLEFISSLKQQYISDLFSIY